MISAETDEARLASPRDAVSRHVIGPHFGDQEYPVALTGNHAADQFLGAAVAVQLCRIDQLHPERNARAQRFFLEGFRMSPLREIRRALTERRDDCSVAELYRTPCTVRSRASGRSTSRCTRQRHNYCADGGERRAERHAKSIEFTSVQQPLVHSFTLLRAIPSTMP